MARLIYMDESGFTGNDLLNKDQEFFLLLQQILMNVRPHESSILFVKFIQ